MLKRLAAPAVAAVVTAAAVFTFGPGPTTPVPPPQTPVTLAQPPAVDAGLVSEPGLAPRPLAAHPSQRRINGPILHVTISAGFHQTPTNPKGWAWPFYTRIESEGWDVVWRDRIENRLKEGYAAVMLHEVPGQWQGIGDCMAWISTRTIATGWSPKMFATWPTFRANVEASGLVLILYSGCASKPNIGDTNNGVTKYPPFTDADLPIWVEGCSTVRRLGAECVGLDALSWVIHTDPAFARKIVEAIRRDPFTANMTLITEGWFPTTTIDGRPIPDVDRQFFLQHLVGMELARGGGNGSGGNGRDPMQDSNWAAIRTNEELALVPGRRGLIWLHGSNFKRSEIDHVIRHTNDLGLYICTDERLTAN